MADHTTNIFDFARGLIPYTVTDAILPFYQGLGAELRVNPSVSGFRLKQILLYIPLAFVPGILPLILQNA